MSNVDLDRSRSFLKSAVTAARQDARDETPEEREAMDRLIKAIEELRLRIARVTHLRRQRQASEARP